MTKESDRRKDMHQLGPGTISLRRIGTKRFIDRMDGQKAQEGKNGSKCGDGCEEIG